MENKTIKKTLILKPEKSQHAPAIERGNIAPVILSQFARSDHTS